MHLERGARGEVVAEASLNPDLDRLYRRERVVHGEIVATESIRAEVTVSLLVFCGGRIRRLVWFWGVWDPSHWIWLEILFKTMVLTHL